MLVVQQNFSTIYPSHQYVLTSDKIFGNSIKHCYCVAVVKFFVKSVSNRNFAKLVNFDLTFGQETSLLIKAGSLT